MLTVRSSLWRRSTILFGALLLFQLLAPRPVAAYVDPLSGSIAIQVVVATILGMTVGIRRSWAAILGFLRKITGRPLG